MALDYRKKIAGFIWHFYSNCQSWPTVDYTLTQNLPADGEMCNECIAKNLLGGCELINASLLLTSLLPDKLIST